MKRDRVTGEVIYIRVPPGTRDRRDVVKGRERSSDFDRRLYLDALDAVEASTKPSTKGRAPRPKLAKTPKPTGDVNEGGNE